METTVVVYMIDYMVQREAQQMSLSQEEYQESSLNSKFLIRDFQGQSLMKGKMRIMITVLRLKEWSSTKKM